MFCEKCGKELPENAAVCMGCGCEVKKAGDSMPVGTPEVVKLKSEVIKLKSKINKLWITLGDIVKQKPKIKKLWVILGAVVLVLGIVAAVLFVPRNLKMDDFKKTNVVTAIIKYGLPESIDTDEEWGVVLRYRDKPDFYGITPRSCIVYPEEDNVFFVFEGRDAYDAHDIIQHYCDLEENLLGGYYHYSYDDMEITVGADGCCVDIEIYE